METLSQRFEATRHQVGDAFGMFFGSTRDAALQLGRRADKARVGFVTRTKTASERFSKSAKTATRTLADETAAATSAFAEHSLGAGRKLVEDLRANGQQLQQTAGTRAVVLRMQAPAGLREVTRQSLVRRLELERTALERIRDLLQLLDARVQQRLGMLDELPANQAELALPSGYDALSARQISAESAHWTHTELIAAMTHEQQTKERSTVLGTLERRLEGFAQAS